MIKGNSSEYVFTYIHTSIQMCMDMCVERALAATDFCPAICSRRYKGSPPDR